MRYDTKWPWVSKYVIVQLPTKIRIVCPFTLLTHLHCQLSASNSDAASPTYASQTQLTMRFLPATHPLTWYTSCRKAMTPNWGGGVAHTIEHRQCQRNGEDPLCTLDLAGFFRCWVSWFSTEQRLTFLDPPPSNWCSKSEFNCMVFWDVGTLFVCPTWPSGSERGEFSVASFDNWLCWHRYSHIFPLSLQLMQQ
jgi:hypothetical protein